MRHFLSRYQPVSLMSRPPLPVRPLAVAVQILTLSLIGGLAAQADHCEYGDAIAEFRGIEVGMIGPDDPRFFERTDPAQARRRRESHHLRQFDIGQSPVFLQFPEDLEVDLIKFLTGHI